MIPSLQKVIDSLRDELQQYGEMLALLETQTEIVAQREPVSVLRSIATIDAQSNAIEKARFHREIAQCQLAWAVGLPQTESFDTLLPLLPGNYRPLISALVGEINQLIERVLERAAQNHRQLQQSLELMEQFIVAISAQGQSVPPLTRRNDSANAAPTAPLSATA